MAWLADYTKRKKITIDNTKVDAALTDFPVLVALSADAQIGAVSNADGFDIRFTSSDGTTLLKYEREDFAIADNKATANFHVKIPSVSSSANTEFYIYYRATDTADGADPTNVWDSNFSARWDMKDKTTQTIEDSTSNDLTGTKDTDKQPAEDTGKIGIAQKYSRTRADRINLGDVLGFERTDPFSIEAWVKTSDTSNYMAIVMKSNTASPWRAYALVRRDDRKLEVYLINTTETNQILVNTTNAIALSSWTHVMMTYDGSSTAAGVKIYVNGGTETLTTVADTLTATIANTNNTNIGNRETHNWSWHDEMDEVRISNNARSAAWVRASYNSGNNSLLSLGNEETETPTATVGQNLQPLLGVG